MKTIAAVVAAAFAGTLFSAEALQIKSYADFKNGNKPSAYVKSIPGGIRVMNNGRTVQLYSVKQIPVDIKKKYAFSCEYRLVPGSKNTGRFYLAPVCYDKQGRVISAVSQKCVKGSDTVLAAAAPKGAKVIKIKNGAKWVTKWGNVAFDVKPQYADLPNFNTIPLSGIKKNDAVWEITLKRPLAKAYPAGTAVREHTDGASFRYMLGYVQPKAQWVKFSRILNGEKHDNMPGNNSSWRVGTAKASVVFFTNGKIDMELRNISIKEVK